MKKKSHCFVDYDTQKKKVILAMSALFSPPWSSHLTKKMGGWITYISPPHSFQAGSVLMVAMWLGFDGGHMLLPGPLHRELTFSGPRGSFYRLFQDCSGRPPLSSPTAPSSLCPYILIDSSLQHLTLSEKTMYDQVLPCLYHHYVSIAWDDSGME